MNKILLFASLVSFNLMAVEPGAVSFGRITDLKGEGFISYKGKTRELRKGDAIEVGSEIVVENHGQVSFTDNADHRFHLGNASSASVTAKSIELRAGDLWFQSLNKNDDYQIQTANAVVSYQGGEAILSYDSVKGKTQLMVINSMMKLSNLRAPELNLSVAEGLFSFIDNAYDEGAPRDPTPVGEKTFGQLTALFKGITPMDKNSAGIFKNHESGHPQGHQEGHQEGHQGEEITKVESHRSIASVTDDADSKMMEDYKNSLLNKTPDKKLVSEKRAVAKNKTVNSKTQSAAKLVVHIYGRTSSPSVALSNDASPQVKSRAPASVLDQDVPTDVVPAIANPYSKDYKNQYKESDKLIDDLKNL